MADPIVCLAGSRPQLSFRVLLQFGPAAVVGALLPEAAWVDALLLAFGIGLTIDPPTLCAIGPPADPGLNGDELAHALQNVGSPEWDVQRDKLTQFALRNWWYNVCECSDGAQPVQVPIAGPPANTPAIEPNPPVIPPTAQPCLVDTQFIGGKNGDSFFDPVITLTPFTVTALQVHFGPVIVTPTFAGGYLEWQFFPVAVSGGTPTTVHRVNLPTNGHVADFVVAVPPGTQQVGVLNVYSGTDPTGTIAFNSPVENFYCGLAPGQPLDQNCCPPDPAIKAELDLILSLLLGRSSAAPPTSWADGASHGPFNVPGSFALVGKATGVRVHMDVLPQGTTVMPGDPDFFWDAGFVTPVALDSPLRGQRLVFQDQSFALPSFTDTVAYTLLHGTVVTFTELLPV